MKKKVAVVVGTYNGERVIGKCVRSLLDTDYENKEVVVVDDGSTDSTPEILSSFGSRITVLWKDRGGVGSARNHVAENTDAEFIATTDDDCVVTPKWVSNAIRHFADPTVGAVTGEKIYRISNIVSAIRSAEYSTRFSRRGNEATSIECPCAVIRRDALVKVGGFDTTTKVGGEDTEFGYRLRKNGYKIVYDGGIISYHDPEASLRMYIKRNYRNGVAYMRNFLKFKSESMNDDFFPLILKLQPLLTVLLFSFLLSALMLNSIFLYAAFLATFVIISATFLPVVSKVRGRLGLKSVFPSIGILHIRNIVWSFALLAGIVKYRRFI